MRKYTFLFSLVVHVGVVAAVLLTTLVVTHTLPGVNPIWEIVIVRPDLPPPPPDPPPPSVRAAPPPAVAEIPLAAPDELLPEPDTPGDVDDRAPSVVDGRGIGVAVGSDTVVGEPVGPPPPAAPVLTTPQRVGGVVTAPTKTHHVPPAYPSIALAARVQGVVILDAVIDEDGAVREVRVLKSIPLLDQAAVDAVRQWRFTPTLLNGQPTQVIMTVTVSFNLR